jgi:hypothetical protein
MTGLGQLEALAPPGLNGRYPFSYPTFGGTHGNGQDAPEAANSFVESNRCG